MLVMNLLQSLLGRAVQLEFHHIDKLVSLQDKVNASFARMIFHLGIEADKLEYDEKHILIMQFLFADHFVGSIRKETLQTAEEGVIITGTHLTDKFLNLKGRFHLIYVLSAGTTASESVPFDFPFVNFHIKRLGFG